MEVSVILPVHNAAPFLERAIQSVLDQPEVVELIAINDASTDDSAEILRLWSKKDDRIYVYNTGGTSPKGPAVARNIGLQNSSSEFIAFLDADDYYLPGRFKHTKKWFGNNPEAEVVIEKVQNISSKAYCEDSNYLKPLLPEKFSIMRQLLSFENIFVQLAGVSIKREVIGNISFEESLYYGEDDMFMLDLARKFKIKVSTSKSMIAHRVLHGNNSIFKYEKQKRNYPILAPHYLSRMDFQLPSLINLLLLKHYLVYSCPFMEKSRFRRYLYYVAEVCRLSISQRTKLVSLFFKTQR